MSVLLCEALGQGGGEDVNWDKVRRDSQMRERGREEVEPKSKEPVKKGGSHVKPGKVRRWEDMTPTERQDVLKRIRRIGDEG